VAGSQAPPHIIPCIVNCPVTRLCHTHGMEYEIIPDGLYGFGVEITSAGRFLSMRGFPTEIAARAWIDE
jgi:hypothetical protein